MGTLITRSIWPIRPGTWKGSVKAEEVTVLFDLMMASRPQGILMFSLTGADEKSIPVTDYERAFFHRLVVPLAVQFGEDGEGKIPLVVQVCGDELAGITSSSRRLVREDEFDLPDGALRILHNPKFRTEDWRDAPITLVPQPRCAEFTD